MVGIEIKIVNGLSRLHSKAVSDYRILRAAHQYFSQMTHEVISYDIACHPVS